MSMRIMRGVSPFHPDKTHLHHLFINHGFSHAGTTMMILLLNTIVIITQLLTWYAGYSAEVQLYIIIAMGAIFSGGLYYGLNALHNEHPCKRAMRAIGRTTHIERKGVFLVLQRLIDRL
jgi:hypothetical protein